MEKPWLIISIGFVVNLAIYSVVTTHLLYLMGAQDVDLILGFIPLTVWGTSRGAAYLCQTFGVISGLLCSVVPMIIWRKARVKLDRK